MQSAATAALALGVRSAAIAPSMLDSGLSALQANDAPKRMANGLLAALSTHARLSELALARKSKLERWVFDVGEARFEHAAEQFRAAFQ